MQFKDISHLRLSNQGLLSSLFKNPAEVVGWLGAVQSQDYHAAKWAVGLRIKNATDEVIEKAYNTGEILRTHVMRPTWHFVLPKDIRWMQELTAHRVKKLLAHYDRKLEITDTLLSQCRKIYMNSLKDNNYLTRTELASELEKHKIIAHGQRLGHIVIHAELDALICSGPRKGKQMTYALLEERVPKTKKLTREESLEKLTTKYFTSHGPAQLADFAWWSGLTMKEAQEGLELVQQKLTKETINNKTYWFSPNTKLVSVTSPLAFLLSIYDEYTIAYKDRTALGEERYFEKLILMGNALTAVIIFDGKIVGTWKREIKKDKIIAKASLFITPNKEQREALHIAAKRYGDFHKLPVEITLH